MRLHKVIRLRPETETVILYNKQLLVMPLQPGLSPFISPGKHDWPVEHIVVRTKAIPTALGGHQPLIAALSVSPDSAYLATQACAR